MQIEQWYISEVSKFFGKEPEGKYFRFVGHYCFYCNYSTELLEGKSSQTQYIKECVCVPQNIYIYIHQNLYFVEVCPDLQADVDRDWSPVVIKGESGHNIVELVLD